MCGRFTLTRSAAEVAAWLEAEPPEGFAPRYNIAPSQAVPVAREDRGRRRLELRVFGLVPRWADDPGVGARWINARAETAAAKPVFREALRRRRCLVPADGFYEWAGARGDRRPYHVALEDGGLFAMAGLYERFEGPGGRALESFAILTTDANARVRALHDRMPVIVDPGSWAGWLDPGQRDGEAALEALSCDVADRLRPRPASRRVNDVHHDAPDCLDPEPERQLGLF